MKIKFTKPIHKTLVLTILFVLLILNAFDLYADFGWLESISLIISAGVIVLFFINSMYFKLSIRILSYLYVVAGSLGLLFQVLFLVFNIGSDFTTYMLLLSIMALVFGVILYIIEKDHIRYVEEG